MNTSSRGHYSRWLLAVLLTVALMVTSVPGAAFASSNTTTNKNVGVQAQVKPQAAADYSPQISDLKVAYNALSASSQAGSSGKEAAAQLAQIETDVRALEAAEGKVSSLEKEIAKYNKGTVEYFSGLLDITRSGTQTSPISGNFAEGTFTEGYYVKDGGEEWLRLFDTPAFKGNVTHSFTSDTLVSDTVPGAAAAQASLKEKAIANIAAKAKDDPAYRLFYGTFSYPASYTLAEKNASDAKAANDLVLATGNAGGQIDNKIAALRNKLYDIKYDELQGLIKDQAAAISDAQAALDKANELIKDIQAKGTLTEAERKALEDYIKTRDDLRAALDALQKAFEAATKATDLEGLLAANKAIAEALKALQDALAELSKKQITLETAVVAGDAVRQQQANAAGAGQVGAGQVGANQTAGGKASTLKVTKIRTPLKTIYLTKNKTYRINYVLDTSDGKAIKDGALKVTVGNKKIVRLVNSGAGYKVRALKTGKTSVTITAQSGKKVKIKIVVQKKKVTLKKFAVKAPKTLKVGKKYQLKISKVTKKASNITAVTFKSSSKRTAKVDAAGRVTALKKGTVEIKVKLGKKKVIKTIVIK